MSLNSELWNFAKKRVFWFVLNSDEFLFDDLVFGELRFDEFLYDSVCFVQLLHSG